jgi:predicted ABC-type transport system involved in lysophospholipase L1 biosynthesis ATPase subunit
MSRPGSPVLRLEGVTKTYGSGQDRLRVLDGVDLELRRGETTSMIGRSGSGKSTLIALAAGLLRPDAGRIHIGGQRTDELDDDARSSLPGVRVAAPDRSGARAGRRAIGLTSRRVPSLDIARIPSIIPGIS